MSGVVWRSDHIGPCVGVHEVLWTTVAHIHRAFSTAAAFLARALRPHSGQETGRFHYRRKFVLGTFPNYEQISEKFMLRSKVANDQS